jgi:hypothetical protein
MMSQSLARNVTSCKAFAVVSNPITSTCGRPTQRFQRRTTGLQGYYKDAQNTCKAYPAYIATSAIDPNYVAESELVPITSEHSTGQRLQPIYDVMDGAHVRSAYWYDVALATRCEMKRMDPNGALYCVPNETPQPVYDAEHKTFTAANCDPASEIQAATVQSTPCDPAPHIAGRYEQGFTRRYFHLGAEVTTPVYTESLPGLCEREPHRRVRPLVILGGVPPVDLKRGSRDWRAAARSGSMAASGR